MGCENAGTGTGYGRRNAGTGQHAGARSKCWDRNDMLGQVKCWNKDETVKQGRKEDTGHHDTLARWKGIRQVGWSSRKRRGRREWRERAKHGQGGKAERSGGVGAEERKDGAPCPASVLPSFSPRIPASSSTRLLARYPPTPPPPTPRRRRRHAAHSLSSPLENLESGWMTADPTFPAHTSSSSIPKIARMMRRQSAFIAEPSPHAP
jgi:hypothetical protein